MSAEDRRGLTALFWSNINPYGTFRLDMDKRLDLVPAVAVPRPPHPGGHPRPYDHGGAMSQTHDFQDLTDPRMNEAA